MQTEKQIPTYMYVVAEHIKQEQDIHQELDELFKKLGAAYDGNGWSVPMQYRQEVKAICQTVGLSAVELPVEVESKEHNNNTSFQQKNADSIIPSTITRIITPTSQCEHVGKFSKYMVWESGAS